MYFWIINLILAVGGILLTTHIWSDRRSGEILDAESNTKCQATLSSRFSKFLGIPVELLGLVFYIIILLASVAVFLFPITNMTPAIWGFTLFSIIGYAFSIYLFITHIFIVKEWCLKCLNALLICELIFIYNALEFLKLDVNPLKIFSFNPDGVFGLYIISISLGVVVSAILAVTTMHFLKDFKISREEDTKLMVVDNISMLALGLALFTNIGLVGTLMYTTGMKVSLVLLIILMINYLILNTWIYPKLIGLRLDFSSIPILRTFIYRQIALALSAISILTWIFIFIFLISNNIHDPVIAISKYISYIVVIVILSQLFPFVIDKMGRKK